MNIPLIILSYNQPHYTMNLVNWFKWYYPNNDIFILDNASTSIKLKTYLNFYNGKYFTLYEADHNNCAVNLAKFIEDEIKGKFTYYAVSDPDIMPHPATPPDFLNYFKDAIDSGYHRAGFDLITEDIPEWNNKKEIIIANEKLAGSAEATVNGYKGRRAAIDTTFCLYTTNNSGWHSPMNGNDWGNGFRIFKAFHLGWYLHPDFVPEEMDTYFKTCVKHDHTSSPAGKNNYRPVSYD